MPIAFERYVKKFNFESYKLPGQKDEASDVLGDQALAAGMDEKLKIRSDKKKQKLLNVWMKKKSEENKDD